MSQMVEYFERCDTFKQANRKATKIFNEHNIPVVIFQYRDSGNLNLPFYYVSTNTTKKLSNDIYIVKSFNPVSK